jgi:hypothetical protein
MHAISGWERGANGYWFKVFFLYWGLEAMTGRVDVFTESYETFSYMGRIIIQGYLYTYCSGLQGQEVGCEFQS